MELKIGNRTIKLMKAHISPEYEYRTVLSNSSFDYVELWLKSQGATKYQNALFYWQQARDFYNASEVLPIESKPLTSYYSIMNATKALLSVNGVALTNIGHGVSSPRGATVGNVRSDSIIFDGSGVLCQLSAYLSESVTKTTYTVFDLLYNLPCVHRTFTITCCDATELFIPVSDVRFDVTNTRNASLREFYLRFNIDSRYDTSAVRKYLNSQIQYATPPGQTPYYRLKRREKWNIHTPIGDRMKLLKKYHKNSRPLFYYIQGPSMLWYIKKELPGNTHIINRHSMTIIYSVMHWLSELVRYSPETFSKLMKSRQNWLIREFVENGLPQFIDEISSEITGANIMCTGIRK